MSRRSKDVTTRIVTSSSLEGFSIPQQFLAYAEAYLYSATRQCNLLKRSHRTCPYPRGSVVLFLAYHAVELFLKATILKRSPEEKLHHDVEALGRTYFRLYPGGMYLWDIPFKTECLGPDPLESLLEPLSLQERKKVLSPANQLYRYPTDNQGAEWYGVFAFEPESFYQTILNLEADFRRLKRLVFEADRPQYAAAPPL